ncbi:hypothetical protein BN946_scf184690.g3 [Trametes cinnabarina]|uniref:DUF6589 domain-containing protein n=1 Tax=Pycnoporus cinnabarinus TaxID=5643 RepID=A0A060STM5_PYCCI|nr:hypothetical protein BN946_scf184690.g3 [Trametes cinnabarina]
MDEDAIHNLLNALHQSPLSQATTSVWAHKMVMEACRQEVLAMVTPDAGLQFRAKTATEEQLESFRMTELAGQMQTMAPTLWSFVRTLLDSDAEQQHRRRTKYKAARRKRQRQKAKKAPEPLTADVVAAEGMDVDDSHALLNHEVYSEQRTLHNTAPEQNGGEQPCSDDADDEGLFWGEDLDPRTIDELLDALDRDEDDEDEELYWRDMDFLDLDAADGLEEDVLNEADAKELEIERREKILTLKAVVLTSIVLQSTNQRCNAFQATVGIYLHACRASESIVELLARIGVSISCSAIDNSIVSLNKEHHVAIQELGQTLRASYAFDNFDVEDKHPQPTIETSRDSLLHLMSGTLIRLEHGVALDDLRCSDELWGKSRTNPEVDREARAPEPDWTDLMDIHTEAPHASSLTRRERFNRWKMLDDLIRYGPEYFRQFAADLKEPEAVDQIPVVKSKQVPAEGMDVNQSTVQGNADALEHLFRQAGVGDLAETPGVVPLGDHVVLVHGDLATCERVQSLQESRSVEQTPWRRFQHVVFLFGLFHLKMACADAIWKIFIKPKAAHEDPTSLMSFVSEIRPKETGKISSKPGFRRMHEVIGYVGIASRLDCWRVEVNKCYKATSLEEWGATKPSWQDIENVATSLVKNHVADGRFSEMRMGPVDKRDQQHENTLLREQYFLLYEELAYALNAGDIGRVEDCFMPWVFIFRGCGKHKYAAQMVKHLHKVHRVFPPGLKRAVQMNMLCNPCGRKHQFRAIDWWVEHNNLYIKRIYGGAFSNFTKRRILKQAALVEVYKKVRISFEEMFALDHRTYRHAAPKMARTLKKLCEYMQAQDAHVTKPKRGTNYAIPDMIEAGICKLMGMSNRTTNDIDEDSAADDEVEVDGDEGDLDML